MNYTVIDVTKELPNKSGKYIVFTKSIMSSNKFETTFKINNENPKNRGVFNVSGQVVTHWLKEI
jgi:hypothetical protein